MNNEDIEELIKQYLPIKKLEKDKNGEVFIFREPLEPSEVGQLYQLFYKVVVVFCIRRKTNNKYIKLFGFYYFSTKIIIK